MESEGDAVGCCGGKFWPVIIGWFQTITCGIFLAISTADLIMYTIEIRDIHGFNGKDHEGYDIVESSFGMVTVTLTYFLGFVAGVYLLLTLEKKNPSRLKTWLLIEWIVVILTVMSFVVELNQAMWPAVFREAIIFVLLLIFLLIVNIHRRAAMLNSFSW